LVGFFQNKLSTDFEGFFARGLAIIIEHTCNSHDSTVSRIAPYSPRTFYEDFLHFATHAVDFVRGEQSMYLYLLSFTLVSFYLTT
jgi:hypothetical protein